MDINIAKFAAVAICFIMAVCNKKNVINRRDNKFLVAGLGCTLVADFFLIIIFNYPIGLIFFCIVQVLYVMRFGGIKTLFWMPFTAVLPIAYFVATDDILLALAMAYAQLFLGAYICMLHSIRKKAYPTTNACLVFAGMTLFMLCDISVAIWNLGRMGAITNTNITSLAYAAIWLFYAPSQVCLAFSARKFAKRS